MRGAEKLAMLRLSVVRIANAVSFVVYQAKACQIIKNRNIELHFVNCKINFYC